MPAYPIDPERAGLLLFDMVNQHVKPADPERARRIAETGVIDGCLRTLRAAREGGIRVFYASGAQRPDGTDDAQVVTDANMNLEPWPEGPRRTSSAIVFEGTPGAQTIDELAPEERDYRIPKHRWSAFAGTHLDPLLRGLGIDTLLIGGGSTDVGIVATAFDGRDRGYNLIFLRDACQSLRPGAHDFCMDRLFPRMGRVMTVQQAIGAIAKPPD